MAKTIFRNILIVCIVIIAVCAAILFGFQYKRTLDETFDSLEHETRYACQGVEMAGISYLENLDTDDRITWIDTEGDVLFDSEFELPIANQSECEEVQEAFNLGVGEGTRDSLHFGEPAMYYAKLCSDGTVLRLSRPVSAALNALIFVSPVLLMLIPALILSSVLAYRAAKQIVRPINCIDLDSPDEIPYPELSPLIKRINEQKQTIKAEESAREQMRREFTANVSHELKTPLTSISGFAELISEGVVPEEKVKEFTKDIYRESQRLITMVDDIIRLSHLDEEAGFPEKEEVDLYELSYEAADTLRPAASKNNISLDINGEHVIVRGVRQLLYDIVYNLCDNAVKYNHPGGTVIIETLKEDERAVLTVEDSGIGISKEHLDNIFERFYRVDKSHSKEIGGTGLGLSIVKHAAVYHDAEIRIKSDVGKGTVIKIVFNC